MHPRTEMLDLVVVDGHARGIVTRDLVTGEIEVHAARRRRAGHRRLRQRLLPVDQRQGLQRHRHLARLQARRAVRQPLLHADPPDLHPGGGDYQSKLTLMSESLRNDGRIWVPKKPGRQARARPDPRGRARLLPGAQVPELRQPGAARHRLPRRQGRCATRAAASARPASASTSISPTPSAPRRSMRSASGTAICSTCTSGSPTRTPTSADADLPRRPLHDGRALGGLQPDDHHPRAVRARRGELLRPRRQPPRRQRAHAGPGRRLLHHPVHDRRLPRRRASPPRSTADDPAVQATPRQGAVSIDQEAAASRASAPSTPSTASSARSCGTTAAWRGTRRA